MENVALFKAYARHNKKKPGCSRVINNDNFFVHCYFLLLPSALTRETAVSRRLTLEGKIGEDVFMRLYGRMCVSVQREKTGSQGQLQ